MRTQETLSVTNKLTNAYIMPDVHLYCNMVATGQGKVREKIIISRSGKSQGIFISVRENENFDKSQGNMIMVREN